MNIIIPLKYLLLLLLPFILFAKPNDLVSTDIKVHTTFNKTELSSLIDLVSSMSNTVHSLQQERGASTGFVSSKGHRFNEKLKSIRLTTNLNKKKMLLDLSQNSKLLQKYVTASEVDSLNKTFYKLKILRKNVQNLKIDFSKTYSKYTQIIAFLLFNISNISDKVQNREIMDALSSYSIFLMYKESVGQKRAALSGLFSQKKPSKEIYEYYLSADTQEKIYLKFFLRISDESINKLYFKTMDTQVIEKVKDHEIVAFEKLNGKDVNINPELWFEDVTKKINLIQSIEYKILDDINVLVSKLDDTKLLFLTKNEKNWIKENPVLKVGVEQWAPVIFSNNGNDIDGIAGDFTKIILRLTGLKIEVVNKSWDDILRDFKNKEIDILPATYYTKERSKYGLYTSSYFKMKDYIYVKKEIDNIKALKDLSGKSMAIIRSYGTIQKIQKKYPNIKLVFTKDLDESIKKLLDGDVDALYEGGIAVENKIHNELITGLKGFPERSFKASALHFFIQKDELVLQSILQKSLDTISNKKKKNIIKTWFFDSVNSNHSNKLNIAFNFDRPPFMFGETSSKGIESDLVKEILQSRGYEVEITQMSKAYLEKILETQNNIDGVSVLISKNKNLYKSDNFISFSNYAITHKKDKLKIDSIKDLTKIKFVAWEGAYNDLGEEFYNLFNPINGTAKESYSDSSSQAEDIRKFFNNKIDSIIIDKTIFQWYKLKYEDFHEYEFHKIFPNSTSYPAVFKSKKVRDEFNIGLKELKKNGRYDEVINFYVEQDIQPLLKFSNLISNISGRFMFASKSKELERVLKEFFQHPDIVHVEVFNKLSEKTFLSLYRLDGIIHNGETNLYQNLPNIKKDIYFSNKGTPLYLGKVTITYKKTFTNDKAELIPKLNSFVGLEDIDKKKLTLSYEKFDLNIKTIELTYDEKEWLKLHKVIKFTGDPDWLPFEAFNDKGEYIGIISEYLNTIESLTGVVFDRIATKSWSESVKLSENNGVDILSETTDSHRKNLIFTKPYIINDIIIVMKKEHKYVEGLNAIKDKKIGITKDYGYIKQIKKKYPNINFIAVNTVSEGLTAVSIGKIDAFICTFALGSYTTTTMGISNIKIVGKTEFTTSLGLGVREDYAPFVNILNKAIDAISAKEHSEIFNHWIKQEYIEKVDYSLLYKVGAGAFSLILMFVFWNRKMSKEIQKRKKAEAKIKESQARLSTLFNASPDSITIVDKNGIYVDCNNATLEMFGIAKKEDFVGSSPELYSPERQASGELSMNMVKEKVSAVIKHGPQHFEWIHKRIDTQKVFEAEVLMSSVMLDGEPYMYGIIRDITSRKELESKIKDSQQQLELAYDAANLGLWDWYTKEDKIITNDNWYTMLGYEAIPSPISLEKWIELVHPDDLPRALALVKEHMEGKKEIYHDIHRLKGANGKWIWINTFGKVSQRDKDGNPIRFLGVNINIDESKRLSNALEESKKEIEAINKHTRDSIEYASLIQHSLIPEQDIFSKYFQDSFAIWHPKDIVGGDIYLMEEISEDEVLLMVIDCTGHGVPGAFVTMLVKAIERQIVANIDNQESKSPAKMLAIFNKDIKHLLKQEDDESISNAGFDGAIVYYNKKDKIIRYAGSNTPFYYYQDKKMNMIKADRHSIGYKKSDANYEFKEHEIDVSQETQVFISTDGYFDQCGGEKGFPFGKKKFIKMIEENIDKSMIDKQEILLSELEKYEAGADRNDDVTVVGIKI